MEPTQPTEKQIQFFESKLLHILIGMFGDDKTLLGHMLEPSDRIILNTDDLMALIVLLTGSHNIQIHSEPIIDKSCCCSKLGSCFEKLEKSGVCPMRVTKILVNGADFFIHYNELFNLFGQYNVSTDYCFSATA